MKLRATLLKAIVSRCRNLWQYAMTISARRMSGSISGGTIPRVS